MKKWNYILGFLVLVSVAVWQSALAVDNELHIVACDVGQGDATLIIFESTQILIDGGPNDSVLACLARHVPYSDQEIELVVLTHPDSDHYRGLIKVFENYQVINYLAPSLDSSNQTYQALENIVGGGGAKVFLPKDVQDIRFGLIHLDILHPLGGREFNEKIDKNNTSTVIRLEFGEFEAIFTGDVGSSVLEDISLNIQQDNSQYVEYIKIPHHGSKNNYTETAIKALEPSMVIISVGPDSQYGHPHKEVIDSLKNLGIDVLRTDEMGDVEIVTNGDSYWIED